MPSLWLPTLVVAVSIAVSSQAIKYRESPYDQTFLRHRSFKSIDQIRSTKPFADIVDARDQSGASLIVTPASGLIDGQDAFVSWSGIANSSPQDYVTISCGSTNGINDFLDAVYVGQFQPGSITNISFAVGTSTNPPVCPDEFIQNDVNLNDGAGGKIINTCFTFDEKFGQPIADIQAVLGAYDNVTCPEGYFRINQDLNEGTTQHQWFIYMCFTYQNYEAGVNDVENILVYSSPNAPGGSTPEGYTDCGQDLNWGTAGNSISFIFKNNNNSVAMPNPVQFSNLINMRCNYTFTYVMVNGNNHTAVASIEVPMLVNQNTPNQVHIGITGVSGQMAITFTSASQNVPQVRFGSSPDLLNTIVNGTTTTYTADDICEDPANITAQEWFRSPGYIHTVILDDLIANTPYFYQCGNNDDGWSEVFQFTSLASTSTRTIGFIAYADQGIFTPPSSQTTAELVNQDIDSGDFNFLLHFGDLSYARGQAWIWEYFFHMIQPYAARIAYMVGVGNHEYDYYTGGENDPSHAEGSGFHPTWGDYLLDSSGECAVPVAKRFVAPQNGNGVFWYSFNAGPVHVIQFSTEHSWLQGSEQYLWLQNDLQQVNRTETPWVVLAGHRMMYTTQLQEEGDYIVSVHMRQEMEDLIYENKVNLMLVGHQHSYERTCLVYRNECRSDGTGTVHIVIGTSGAGLEGGGYSNSLGNFSLVHLENWGYLRVFATESTLTTQFVLNDDQSVYDSFTLHPWGQPQQDETEAKPGNANHKASDSKHRETVEEFADANNL